MLPDVEKKIMVLNKTQTRGNAGNWSIKYDTCFICIGRVEDRNVWAQVTQTWKGKQVSFSWETKSYQSCTVNYIFKDSGDNSQKYLVKKSSREGV